MTATSEAQGTPKRSRSKKVGLRSGQVRILRVLARIKNPIRRRHLAKSAKCTLGWTCNHVGPTDPSIRARTEARTGYPSLLTLGYVKVRKLRETDKITVDCYEITTKGREAFQKASSK